MSQYEKSSDTHPLNPTGRATDPGSGYQSTSQIPRQEMENAPDTSGLTSAAGTTHDTGGFISGSHSHVDPTTSNMPGSAVGMSEGGGTTSTSTRPDPTSRGL